MEERLNKESLIDRFKESFDTASTTKQVDDRKSKNDESPNRLRRTKQQTEKMSSLSQTHSAEEDNLEESSEDECPMKNRSTVKKIEKSKSTFNLSELKSDRSVTDLDDNISTTTIASNVSKDINPLKSLLNNSELLQFVVNPVPRNKVYQCTIIRDKKGLDRSLYPTYYMHLQTINSKDDNQSIRVEDFKDVGSVGRREENGLSNGGGLINGSAKQQTNDSLANGQAHNQPDDETNESHNRQVFLLSGRRRKKSKTYLISCNPFEITRMNSIAKLKSNVIGTQFNTIRILHTGQRLDYATIIYVSFFCCYKTLISSCSFVCCSNFSNFFVHLRLFVCWLELSKF